MLILVYVEVVVQEARVSTELVDVIADRIVLASSAIIGIVTELKRDALLANFATRNAEVADVRRQLEAATERLQVEGRVLEAQIAVDQQVSSSFTATIYFHIYAYLGAVPNP